MAATFENPDVRPSRPGKILLWDQADLGRPVLSKKIFRLTCRANHPYKLAPSHPNEGRVAIVTNVAMRCGGRRARDRRARARRTAKACGSGTAALVSSSREAKLPGGDGGKKAVRREEHAISRKPSRREGRIASASPVCSCAHSTISAHGTAGATRTRSSLRLFLIQGAATDANPGRIAPRERGCIPSRCLTIKDES